MIKSLIFKLGFRRVYRIFAFFRNFYLLLDYILDLTFGYSLVHGWKNERNPKLGNLVKILGRFNGSPGTTSKDHHFIMRHEKYVNPIGQVCYQQFSL